MHVSQIVSMLSPEQLRTALADLAEHQLRAAVQAAVDAPAGVTPAEAVKAQAKAKDPSEVKVKAQARAKAPKKDPGEVKAPSKANAKLTAAIASLAPHGFARKDLAAAAQMHPNDPAVAGATKRAVAAGELFAHGDRRWTRYGESEAIAQARSDKDRGAA